MGKQRQGRTQIEPGPWSRAVSTAFASLVDARPGRRDKFKTDAGFSGRLAKLLNGERAWYLEDVERACDALGLDVVEFLGSLEVDVPSNVVPLLPTPGPGTPHPSLPSVTRYVEDDDVAADESPDEDAEREARGE